ncbi:cytochrome P450 [Hypoxylon trugodes]|uniref:cytochrome P450 n=1 Tax=Hypoxylon trugodes TaxID=326681 RepID=UPI00218D2BF6|nr:cytochrome P450 [Hypoxylon trugodes]KAI1391783.1 cytochrome P450 [Hypoxylon trugodes]
MAATDILIGYAVSASIFYVIVSVSYRLLLHPLRKYPGPFIAKLSDAYEGYFAAARRLHLKTYQDHIKYGPIVRHGPNKLLFNSVTALRDIYQNDRVVKASIYRASQVQPDKYNVFNSRDKSIHRTKRRLVGQALSDHSLRQFEPTLLEEVDKFLNVLLRASKNSSPVNMTPTSRHLGLDAIGQLGFGYDLKMQSEEENRFLMNGLVLAGMRINTCMSFPLLIHLRLDLLASLIPNSIRTRLLAVVEKMIATRLAQPVDAKHDLLSFIVPKLETDFKDVKKGDLWPEAVFFFGAGGDTTATAMAGAFFYLSRNLDCYEKLAAEVRSTFASADEIRSGRQLASCRYLRACIDEALRMSSPVSATPWREKDPKDEQSQPLVIDGQTIPQGTLVGVNIYSLHHNEEYFPNPFKYQPGRWLVEDHNAKAAFNPFSTGPRVCAGKSLAYTELSLVLAKTLWYFDFEPAPGQLGKIGEGTRGRTDGRGRKDEFQLYDIFGSYHDGPYLVFRSRAQYHQELDTNGFN